jgi:hypothetical protein
MHEMTDDRLELALRGSLRQEAEALPSDGWRDGVRDRVRVRLAADRPHRRPWLLLGEAAALVVGGAALLAGSSPRPTPDASAEYEAIFVRPTADGVLVVAAAGDAERPVALIPSLTMGRA